jgi:aspartyl-tRNA(Asn)/glutamyl-tRNA(Gln) amidotransferase subunit C
MPRITEDTVESVARLARLSLTPAERSRFARELAAIVAWADSLQALDTEGVAPLRQASGGGLRDDTARDGLPRERALEQAPDAAEGLFRVPRVLP